MADWSKLEKEIEMARAEKISWESIDHQLCMKLMANVELRKHFNITEPREIDIIINYMKEREENNNGRL